MLLPCGPDIISKQKLQGYELAKYDINLCRKGQPREARNDMVYTKPRLPYNCKQHVSCSAVRTAFNRAEP